MLRAFKKEGELELWVENPKGTYILVKRYSICATSGTLGPKRRFGDEQGPEGFYELDWFNPESNFYLSLHVSYPNASDRILGSRIGCIPITDDGIKEICWMSVLACNSGQRHIPIEIFPARLTTAGLDQLAATHRDQADLVSFWMNLKEGFDFFEKRHRPPFVRVDGGGRYAFSAK